MTYMINIDGNWWEIEPKYFGIHDPDWTMKPKGDRNQEQKILLKVKHKLVAFQEALKWQLPLVYML